jgi:hypothetical protein
LQSCIETPGSPCVFSQGCRFQRVAAEPRPRQPRGGGIVNSSSKALHVARETAITVEKLPFGESDLLAELRELRFRRDRPGFHRAEAVYMQVDRRGEHAAFGHDEDQRPHRVVEHRREEAALHDAQRIEEF